MVPAPQEHNLTAQEIPETEQIVFNDNAIVISGISGIFPEANNLEELSDILYNKVNAVTPKTRWDYKHPETSHYAGKAPGLEHFDAQFFTIYHSLGIYLDPMARKLLEHTYQAIYDAGLCPADLSGKKVAVFVGSSFSSTDYRGVMDYSSKTGLGIVGSNKAMFSNRISYWLNVKGPSIGIDQTDCSTYIALEQAVSAIKRGDCDAAIVGGANLYLHPHSSIFHKRLQIQSSDGKTKSFAADADGYALSDAVGVLFIQKRKDAFRAYAEVKHVKTDYINQMSDGSDPKYGYARNPQVAAEFIKGFYKEAQVPPQAVDYVEAYGTGVPDADKSELEAIIEVYCKDREEPLMVGSVTSNIGLTEAASGICSIAKVLLAYSKGEVAANLHCDHPRGDIEAIREGRVRIVTEHQPIRYTYAAVNGMSVSGANSHVLLRAQYKPKDLSRYNCAIPRLVTISGRQDSAVQRIFDHLKSKAVDAEEIALLQNIHSKNTSGHLGRGYIILDTDEDGNTVTLAEKAEFFDAARRPLWFVYSGMGSQWAGMGAQLLGIPVFAAAIERCRRVLEPKGLDIVDIITSNDNTIFDNILHSFVGIAAVQIGLTDVLHEMGLKPDGIIGHSVGELGCAYADGCVSAEEMILCAYSRGMASLETPIIRGSMAAVGLGFAQVSKMCPPGIDVACRNSADSSTISGPADIMRDFVAELTASGVFAKEVPCSNIAYHSRYIKEAGPNLLKYLKEIIKHPKARSERWLSTSIPQDNWNNEQAKYCSAEYQTNNLLSPVLFEETTRLIPSNAVLVEVAPHGLLQAILKRSLPTDCLNVPLTKRGHKNNVLYFLQAIGDLYTKGYLPKVQALYPKAKFPVSTGTPMLSHLIEWAHMEKWYLTTIAGDEKRLASAAEFIISVNDEEHSYLRGNIISEKMCFPYASALVAVWDTLMMNLEMPKRESSVEFYNICCYSQPLLHNQKSLRVSVRFHRGTGSFEVMNKTSRVVSGQIKCKEQIDRKIIRNSAAECINMELSSKDLYRLLEDRDYNYSGKFRSIQATNSTFSDALILWQDNWATFIDAMLQLNMLQQPHHGVSLPTHIGRLYIDVKDHVNSHYRIFNSKRVMVANINNNLGYTKCGGVAVYDIKFKHLPPITNSFENLKLNTQPGDSGDIVDTKQTFKKRVNLQSSAVGKLDSLHWEAAPEIKSGLTVTVHFSEISMLDVKRATGTVENKLNLYGMDYSGVTNSGERVMGIVHSGAASTQVEAQPELLWPVPAHWSLEDAATVPLAYALAFYCLKIKGDLCRGMNVLVHGGAGALGQAAISILLAHDCRVFTTVSDIRKKQFLRKLYPQLKDEDICNSRNSSYADHVRAATHNLGCEIAIGCQKGRHKDATMECLAFNGKYIDTTLVIERENYEFGMFHMTRSRMYYIVDITSLFKYNKYEDMKRIQKMVMDGIADGYVRPLTRVRYAPQDVSRAFRLMANSRHGGRTLLRMQENTTEVQARIICNPKQSQVIFWYNDVLGVQLVERLIKRAAKKIFIHIACPTAYHQYKIGTWKKLGTEVTLSSVDLIENKNVTNLLNNAMRIGTVEGIYIVSDMNGRDSKEDFKWILKNIDASSRELCPNLRYFAVVSMDGDLAQDICLTRASGGYAATCLDLSHLRDFKTSVHIPRHLAVEAIERAICSPYSVLQAHKQSKQSPSMLRQIAALADLKVAETADAALTLRELGISEENLSAISEFLNATYNVYLVEDEIPNLTLKAINELQESVTETVFPNVRGLATFFYKSSCDDLTDTTDVVSLPTLYKDPTLSGGEFDVNQRYLCILPGMNGHHDRFRVLCERLKLPAIVLQPGLDHPNDTVSKMGQRLTDTLMQKNMAQKNFYLLAHESGVLVALEMAVVLENFGFTGTLFLMGFDPEEFQTEIEEQLSDLVTVEQLEDALVWHISKLFVSVQHLQELDNALQTATTWTQKVHICVQFLRGRTGHSMQYTRALLETALGRLKQVRGYKAKARPLRSKLVLLRAATRRDSTGCVKRLQQYSSNPVTIHQLSVPLAHATYDIQSAAIVNRHLDDETRKAFESKSLCESYNIALADKSYSF